MPDDDARDERIAGALGVEPLDEVTRRRLVATALAAADEQPVRRSSAARWIVAAASIVILLAAALALLTAPGGNDDQQASTPAGSPQVEQKSAGVTDGAAASAAGAAADSVSPQAVGAPPDAGGFGDLDVPANLDRLRTALEGAGALASSGAPATALPCRDDLPAGTVTATATGTLDGRPVVVVLTKLADGRSSIDAVLTSPCEVRPLS